MRRSLRRTMNLALAVGATATFGTLTAAAGTLVPAASAASGHSCGSVTVKGHMYNIYASGVKCSVAKAATLAFAAKKVPQHQVVHWKGPKGYNCQAYAGAETGGVQGSGSCSKGILGTGAGFNWSIATSSS